MQIDFRSGADYSVNVSGPPLLSAGSSAIYYVTTTTVNGSAGNVTLAISGLPPGVSSVVGASSNGTTPVTLTAASGVASGSFTFTATASNGTFARIGQLLITIPARSDFFISANPAKSTPNWVTSMNVVVTASQGFSSAVTLVPTGLPSGAVVYPTTQQVNGSGIASFVITTTNSPIGDYPIRITPNGNANKGVTAFLTVSAPTPATMLSPSPGSNLPNSANEFVWAAPVGATQVQFQVGSSTDANDLFSFATSATASANCMDGSFQCQSATALSLPTGQSVLYAKLSSLIDGAWSNQYYQYTKSQAGLSYSSTLLPRVLPGPSHYVVNNNLDHFWQFCLTPGVGQPCGTTADYDYKQLSTCNIGKSFVRIVGGIMAPERLVNETLPLLASRFTLKFVAEPRATPGPATLTCAGNRPAGSNSGNPTFAVSLANAIQIYDGTPVISSIKQYEPETAGGAFYITIYGRNLGANGSIDICPAGANPCTTNASDMSVDVYGQYTYWSHSQINALVTPNPVGNGAYALYDVIVRSDGANGLGFADPPVATPGQPQGNSSNRQQITILKTKIFVVHGLGDTYSSMGPIGTNLAANLNQAKFEVDWTFNFPSCQSIATGAFQLAQYVRLRIGSGQRVAFVAHSMGGLIIRSMLVQGLLSSTYLAALEMPKATVVGLATLGTPHIGAPSLPSLDWLGKCQEQLQEMEGHLTTGAPISTVLINSKTYNGVPFLEPLMQSWDPSTVNFKWFAASGRACSNPYRATESPGIFTNSQNGCLDTSNPYSDGAVCDQSARAAYPGVGNLRPTIQFTDPTFRYQHATNIAIPGTTGDSFAILMCGNNPTKGIVIDPPIDPTPFSLWSMLKEFLNGL